jgi:hypothetical protein
MLCSAYASSSCQLAVLRPSCSAYTAPHLAGVGGVTAALIAVVAEEALPTGDVKGDHHTVTPL